MFKLYIVMVLYKTYLQIMGIVLTASNDTDQTRSQLNTAFSEGSSEYDLVSIDTVK